MKRIVFFLIISCVSMGAFAQNQNNPIPLVSPDSAIVYRLFSHTKYVDVSKAEYKKWSAMASSVGYWKKQI